MVAPPVYEPGRDTAATFFSASSPCCARTAAVFDSAFAQCHGSGLLTLRLLFFHSSAVPFLTSPSFRKVFTGLAWTACPSRSRPLTLFHLSVFFVWPIPFFFRKRQSRP